MNSPESFSQNQEKSQTEIRENFERKLNTLISSVRVSIEEYEAKLKDGSFEDKDGEPEGLGEKRKQEMEHRISSDMDRVEAMKAKLDSGEEITATNEEVSVDYRHTNPVTKVEHTESININIERKLEEFISFYRKTNIDLPADFEETIRDIWKKNIDEIERCIEENGFNDMLIIPGNIPLAELAEKMKMENGYSLYKVDADFGNVSSSKVDKPRIILYHRVDSLEEIQERYGISPHLGITGDNAYKLYESNPQGYLSTLEDAIILERKYFEDTSKHISVYSANSSQWLPGSMVGPRFVHSRWNPDAGKLGVYASGPGRSAPALGCRATRYFS